MLTEDLDAHVPRVGQAGPRPRRRYREGGLLANDAASILPSMNTLDQIKAEVAKLPAQDVRQLAQWLAGVLSDRWDQEIEADARTGRLDKLRDQVMREQGAGEIRPLEESLGRP